MLGHRGLNDPTSATRQPINEPDGIRGTLSDVRKVLVEEMSHGFCVENEKLSFPPSLARALRALPAASL
jgi:hypothetical protein